MLNNWDDIHIREGKETRKFILFLRDDRIVIFNARMDSYHVVSPNDAVKGFRKQLRECLSEHYYRKIKWFLEVQHHGLPIGAMSQYERAFFPGKDTRCYCSTIEEVAECVGKKIQQ